MVAAFAPRRFGVQNRLILAGIQVAPLPLRLMVVQFAGRAAFRAPPIDHVTVPETNMDLAGMLNSENTAIEFVILHPRNCRMSPPGPAPYPLRTLNSPLMQARLPIVRTNGKVLSLRH